MESNPPDVVIRLSQKEALVLFEWLARFYETKVADFEDDAEQTVVWRVEGLLERQLVAIFDPRYKERVAEAWAFINDPDEDSDVVDRGLD